MFKLAESALFGRKKASSPFKNVYNEWLHTLRHSLLPQLRRALTSASSPTILATYVDAVHRHFQSYYEALDSEATRDVTQLLYPEWRNSLEKPFLWLGDVHPYLFTNLLRSLIDDDDDDDQEEDAIGKEEEEERSESSQVSFRESRSYLDKPWHVMMAWSDPSRDLMVSVDQIERGLRLMVPSLVARARKTQAEFVERVGVEWRRCGGNKEEMMAGIREVMAEEMAELEGVFVDANRLRSSVLADILNATNIYQAALFYQELSQFLVGFHDQKLLREFQKSKKIINS